MLRRYFHIQDPEGLTLEKWDELLECRNLIAALDGDGDLTEASAERDRQLKRRRGW